MLGHFGELLAMNRRRVVAVSLIAALVTFVISEILLVESPVYKSTVSITMQPSDEELTFNRAFMGVSQFNPATVIAQSHVERLLSRPVRQRTVEILLEGTDAALGTAEQSAFERFRAWFWRTWNTINYGFYVPLTPEEELDVQLQEAVSLEIVEGSYIILIEAAYEDPVWAAAIANAYAQAYVEIAQEDFHEDASEIQTLVNGLIERREAELDVLVAERGELQRTLGVGDVSIQWELLLNEQQRANGAMEDARIEAELSRSRADNLRQAVAEAGTAEIAQRMNEELAMSLVAVSSDEQRLELLQDAAAQADAAIADFVGRQSQIEEIDLRINAISANLADLQSRRVALDLSNEARLSQVRVIDPASIPRYPTFPKVFLNTVTAAIVGAILAALPILLGDAVSTRMTTYFDLRNAVPGAALPTMTRSLAREARRYLRSGGKPPRKLRAFAERLGQQMGRDGWWSNEQILVAAFSEDDSADDAADVLRASIAFLTSKFANGTGLEVTKLPEAPAVTDWEAREDTPLVLVVGSNEAEGAEIRDFLEGLERKVAPSEEDAPPRTTVYVALKQVA
jgi:uncharacterized protein involved in exopolysaccharide biosynthesis